MERTGPDLSATSLSDTERRVVVRLVDLLEAELGGDLRGVWLYGSRARGEPRRPESDVDLLVVTRSPETWSQFTLVQHLVDQAAQAEGASPVWFSAHVYSDERLAQRRAIRSFFIQEVDRDKLVLAGRA